MYKNKEANSSLAMKKSTVLRLKSMKKRLGFSSLEQAVIALLDVRDKFGWDRIDLETLALYGRLPEVIEGRAKNDKEMYEQLGLDKNAKKRFEEFVEFYDVYAAIAKPFTEKIDLADPNKPIEKKKFDKVGT